MNNSRVSIGILISTILISFASATTHEDLYVNGVPVGNLFESRLSAEGDVLIFTGQVKDTAGRPQKNVVVEIWQTDARGVYDHPGDAGTGNRDRGFQFYGSSTTDNDGYYVFRTILPGRYEPRPRHIHFKVKDSGRTILTSQIYFVRDGSTMGAGGSNDNLKMAYREFTVPSGEVEYRGKFDIIIEQRGVRGQLRPTDSQAEGPYYPRTNPSLFDNDLASVD